MSIEANTCEKIIVRNGSEKTAEFVKGVEDYLLKTWGILSLRITADEREYETDEESISEDSALFPVINALHSAGSIEIDMRSENSGGLAWRRESCFLAMLDDDDDMKNDIVYKSIDCYDQDQAVDLCSFGKAGLRCPEDRYEETLEKIRDIEEWHCYTPVFSVSAEDPAGAEPLYISVLENLRLILSLCGVNGEETEDMIEDNWSEDGEILLNGSLRFRASDVDKIMKCLSDICRTAGETRQADCEIEINAVPDGPDDYDFAVLSMKCREKKLHTTCARI